MCYGIGCRYESHYWGECRKPRGEECPMTYDDNDYEEDEEETMRITHGHNVEEEECDPAILEDQLERSTYAL